MIPNRDTVRQGIVEAIASELRVSSASIAGNDSLQHLGFSSLEVMKFIGGLEDTFGLRLEPNVFYDFPTIDALTQHLHGELAAASSTAEVQAQAS